MQQTLGIAFTLTIACSVSFYAARGCLRGVIFFICRSAARSTLRHNQDACQNIAVLQLNIAVGD
jgi:hypothetical protein